MNGVPVARQSRGTARPQAGKSTFPHQAKHHPILDGVFVLVQAFGTVNLPFGQFGANGIPLALQAQISLSRSENITPAKQEYHLKTV